MHVMPLFQVVYSSSGTRGIDVSLDAGHRIDFLLRSSIALKIFIEVSALSIHIPALCRRRKNRLVPVVYRLKVNAALNQFRETDLGSQGEVNCITASSLREM